MPTLDETLVKKPKPEESHSLGFAFGIPAQIIGAVLTLIGLLALISLTPAGFLFGPVVLFGGLFLLTSSYGTQIDYQNQYIREYGSFVGIKRGKWKNLDKYPYITVLTANVSRKSSDVTGLVSVVDTKEAYGIYFLSKTHFNRILFKRVKGDFADAKEEAKKIEEKTGKPLVKFSPAKLSARNR